MNHKQDDPRSLTSASTDGKHPVNPVPVTAQANNNEWFKLPEVAAKIGVSTRTVWRLVANEQLSEPAKFGGGCRWSRSDIDSYEARADAKRIRR